MSAPEKKFETKSAPVATGDSYNDKKSAVTPPSSVRKSGERLCKVYRRGENQNAPVTVTPGDIKLKKEFFPGQPVYLTDKHIAVLRDACIDSEISIPDNSGIYESANPQFEAQKRNPGYEARVDIQTGSVYLRKKEPLYIVEILE